MNKICVRMEYRFCAVHDILFAYARLSFLHAHDNGILCTNELLQKTSPLMHTEYIKDSVADFLNRMATFFLSCFSYNVTFSVLYLCLLRNFCTITNVKKFMIENTGHHYYENICLVIYVLISKSVCTYS